MLVILAAPTAWNLSVNATRPADKIRRPIILMAYMSAFVASKLFPALEYIQQADNREKCCLPAQCGKYPVIGTQSERASDYGFLLSFRKIQLVSSLQSQHALIQSRRPNISSYTEKFFFQAILLELVDSVLLTLHDPIRHNIRL
jgi:hypothetical protein